MSAARDVKAPNELELIILMTSDIEDGSVLTFQPLDSSIPASPVTCSFCNIFVGITPEQSQWWWLWNEPCHEIMVLFVLRKLILQTRMRSHPVQLDVWCLFRPFVYFHTSCTNSEGSGETLECAGSPELSLVAYVISTIISWAGSNWV